MSQPFSSMNGDNLHHLEKPDIFPEPKDRAGHDMSTLQKLFTKEVDPQRQARSTCCQCHTFLFYQNKFERVKDNLFKCSEFSEFTIEMREDSHLIWFDESLLNRKVNSGQSFSSGVFFADINKTVLTFLFEAFWIRIDRKQPRYAFLSHRYLILTNRGEASGGYICVQPSGCETD